MKRGQEVTCAVALLTSLGQRSAYKVAAGPALIDRLRGDSHESNHVNLRAKHVCSQAQSLKK